ncbi:MAG TPA: ATP-binding cassette domain-containing protein [Acidimicrobiales bacterium]|nr:ATP-binding cassette domain-containing protein [Acidimicrobiales bacterium]
MPSAPTLRFDAVTVRRGTTDVLVDVTWRVEPDERWIVLGPNGSGKTTLLQLATGHLHPTRGLVHVLGTTLGRTDVRRLRTRIGLVSGAVTRMLRPELTAHDVVVTGRHAALEPWWHDYTGADHERADALLVAGGFPTHAARHKLFAVLSEGERQQVLLARAVMGEPELLVFDEPAAGLDLAARERLVRRLHDLANDATQPPIVFVTHHVEEIPPGFGHLLLLRDGRPVAQGRLEAQLTSTNLSVAFGLDVEVHRRGDRYTATATSA